jgi:hypothetical protein
MIELSQKTRDRYALSDQQTLTPAEIHDIERVAEQIESATYEAITEEIGPRADMVAIDIAQWTADALRLALGQRFAQGVSHD